MNLDDMSNAPLERILIFSDPNMGKTFALGQLAAKFHLHWIDLESGVKTLLQANFPKELRKNVTVYSIPDNAVNPVGIRTMLKLVDTVRTKKPISICEAHGVANCPECIKADAPRQVICLPDLGPTDCLIIDGLNQLQASAMASIRFGKDDMSKAEWDDYGNQGSLMSKILSIFQTGLTCHLGCTSHPIEVEMEDGSKKLVPIAGTTNFSRNTAKYFDHIVYIKMVGNKRQFISLSTTNAKISAGSRYSIDLSKDSEPSLLKLFQDVDYSTLGAVHKEEIKSGTEAVLNSAKATPAITVPTAPTAPTATPASLKSLMNFKKQG